MKPTPEEPSAGGVGEGSPLPGRKPSAQKKPAASSPAAKPAAPKPAPKLSFPPPIKKADVKKTEKNYGFALSGKAGSRPDLEKEYVLHFVVEDPKDGVTSLREAMKTYLAAGAKPEDWPRVQAAQRALEVVKEKLRKAGYTPQDLMKLTLDNS